MCGWNFIYTFDKAVLKHDYSPQSRAARSTTVADIHKNVHRRHLDDSLIKLFCVSETHGISPLWPLLLTWFNFNPSMDM